jgi:hypothetical protein
MTFKHLTPLCLVLENVSLSENWLILASRSKPEKTKETNQRKFKEISILLILEEPCYAGETSYIQNLY